MRALVVTSVHRPDDPRVRERTARSLASAFTVRFAAREPGPSDPMGLEWVPLRGGRLRRDWQAFRQMLRRDVDVVSLHDPELILPALAARLLRRVPVVVDVHEDVAAQMLHKEWVWRLLRRPLAWAGRLLLRLAERFCVVTLAEEGYRSLFRRDHPVFPNYPAAGSLPPLAEDEGYLVYVGDITADRGATDMIDAVAAMAAPRPLVLVGRCRRDLAGALRARAVEKGVSLALRGPWPHRRAMEEAGRASAGLSLLRPLPNYLDSLPTKVMEYLQLGLPVAATDLPGTRAAVEGRAAVELVPPGDAGAAGAALDRLTAEGTARRLAAAQAPGLRAEQAWPDEEVVALYRRTARPAG